jgi:hypothetical protein
MRPPDGQPQGCDIIFSSTRCLLLLISRKYRHGQVVHVSQSSRA